MKKLRNLSVAAVFVFSLNSFTGCETLKAIWETTYVSPYWAPAYYPGARYYYLPDIETYYDLSVNQFVYLSNGQWYHSYSLPSMYGWYDLYNSFVITLNINVYQPWMHHQYYVSHYPRYYYHNTYRDRNFADIRGFNENRKEPVYWQPGERDKIKDLRKNEPVRKPDIQRPPQNTNYYGKPIGEPVKVRPDMRNKEQAPVRKLDEKPKKTGVN